MAKKKIKKKKSNETMDEHIFNHSQSSVTIKRDSKGRNTFEVKVYCESPELAKETATTIFDELTEEYPEEN
jgi:ABC-type Zn2+ transport system substrate-binding protein/surface adhesin